MVFRWHCSTCQYVHFGAKMTNKLTMIFCALGLLAGTGCSSITRPDFNLNRELALKDIQKLKEALKTIPAEKCTFGESSEPCQVKKIEVKGSVSTPKTYRLSTGTDSRLYQVLMYCKSGEPLSLQIDGEDSGGWNYYTIFDNNLDGIADYGQIYIGNTNVAGTFRYKGKNVRIAQDFFDLKGENNIVLQERYRSCLDGLLLLSGNKETSDYPISKAEVKQ